MDQPTAPPTPFRLTAAQRLALAFARCGLTGKHHLMVRAGVHDDRLWESAPSGTVRLRWCNSTVELDLAERWERLAYFYARYHELPLLLLMRAVLRPGDTFVDVGANLGLVTLLAAKLVGPGGRVHAYEPNPEVFARLDRHVGASPFRNIVLHPVALGSREERLKLSVIGRNTGSGTLGRPLPHLVPHVARTYEVPVRPAIDASRDWAPAPTPARVLLKIDVEGAEREILASLIPFVRDVKPAIATEINPPALRMNGTNAAEVRESLAQSGCDGWTFGLRNAGLRRFRAARLPLPPVTWPHLHDELWVRPDSPMRSDVERGARLVEPVPSERSATAPV